GGRARVPFVPDGPDLVRHRRGHGPSRDARKGRTEHRRDPRLDHGRQRGPSRNLRDPQERRPGSPGIGRGRRGGETETRHGIRGPPAAIEESRPEPVPTRSFATPTATGKPARTPLQNRIEQLRRNRREAERRIPLGDRKLLYRELPKLVNEVKPLLVSAKRIG